MGTTTAQTPVTLYNYGNTTLTLSTFTIGGTNASEFSISLNQCASTLTGGGNACSVYVKFSPTATGQRVAFLQITDSASDSPQAVSLYGTGQ